MRDWLYLGALGLAVGLATAGAIRVGTSDAIAADHKESGPVRLDPSADINDVYAFVDPASPSQLVLGMTVNPFIPPPSNTSFFFDPTVFYVFHIDRNGDSVEDLTYTIQFGSLDSASQQSIIVNGVSGGKTTPISVGPTAPAAVINTFTVNGQTHTIFAGQREDPFFFDLVGFIRLLGGASFPRTSPPDSFQGVNTSAIVLSCPLAALQGSTTTTKFGVWGTTAR
ncbi:MAG: DUF4331 family protein [Planctomycetota bacterium]